MPKYYTHRGLDQRTARFLRITRDARFGVYAVTVRPPKFGPIERWCDKKHPDDDVWTIDAYFNPAEVMGDDTKTAVDILTRKLMGKAYTFDDTKITLEENRVGGSEPFWRVIWTLRPKR